MVFIVIAALLVTGVGYGLATLREFQAQSALADAQARTLALIEERSELSETLSVINVQKVVTQTRLEATVTEVIWADVFDRVTGVLPPAGYLEWLAQGTTPWDSQLAAAGPLREARVASMTIKVTSPTPFDATALLRRILELEGIADASLDSIEIPQGETAYEATFTLNLSDEALSGRWIEEETIDGADAQVSDAEEGQR